MTRWEAFKKEKGIKTEKKEKIVLDKDKIKHNYVKMSVEYDKLKPTIESKLTHKHFSFPL